MKQNFALAALLISACCANAADNPPSENSVNTRNGTLSFLAEEINKNPGMSLEEALAAGKVANDNFDMDKPTARVILQKCALIVAQETAFDNIEYKDMPKAGQRFLAFYSNLLNTVSGREITSENGFNRMPELNKLEWKTCTTLLHGDHITPATKVIYASYLSGVVVNKARKEALDEFITTTKQNNKIKITAQRIWLVDGICHTSDANGKTVPYTINGICQTSDADGNMIPYIVDGTPVTADANGNIVPLS